MAPHGGRAKECEGLEKSLSNHPELNVGMVGADLPANLVAIARRLVVEVLIAGTSWTRRHGAHPKMVGIGADSVDCLFETDLDLEPDAEDFDNLQGGQGPVGGQQDFPAAIRVDNQDEADKAAGGFPIHNSTRR